MSNTQGASHSRPGRGRGNDRGRGRGRGRGQGHRNQQEPTARPIHPVARNNESTVGQIAGMAGTGPNAASNTQGGSYSRPGRGRGIGRGRGGGKGKDEQTGTSRSRPRDQPTSSRCPSYVPPSSSRIIAHSRTQGHHAGLRTALSGLSSSLLDAFPPIRGLDTSIVVPPRRAHLTLGAMALPDGAAIERALGVLRGLQTRVARALSGRRVYVGLERIDVMRLEPDGSAHVMFAGPDMASTEARRLWAVASMIQREFIQSGLMPDERRPLKLHCTLLNTVYRRRRPRAGRIPFSYTDVLASAALRARALPAVALDVVAQTTGATRALAPLDVVAQTEVAAADVRTRRPQNTQPVRVDLGAWPLDEVQLCEMGSWGPEGEYVAVGAIDLM